MHKTLLLFLTPTLFAAAALSASSQNAEILARAHRLQLEFRQGNPAVAKPLVAALEAATAQSRDDAELWEALGHAYMSLQGSHYSSPPDFPALIDIGQRARAAYARALALDPTDSLVRSSHGMSTFVVSQLQGDAAGMQAGREEMDAAVREAPRRIAVRLTRGFTMIHLPPAMRDTNAVIEDLKFIMDTAPGGRAEDVLRVMLGDVYAEMGDLPAARQEYAQVTGASAFAVAQTKLRAARDAIPTDLITTVRMGTGTNCAMCHAPGTDD
jgi:hypothetical protein